MAHYQLQPLAVWNPARDAWEIPGTEGLTCAHLAVFSETWPSSGSMRNGTVFARPTSGPVTTDSGYSFLPTPWAATFGEVDDLDGWEARRARAIVTLPTPTARDYKGRNQRGDATCLTGALDMLPTPRASDGTNGGPNQRGSSGDLMLPSAVQPSRWGQYADAVARHARLVGRVAPDPTEKGPKGGDRLAARFVEWMMGLPAGWVTGCGLTRTEALKALGNGVVPQQAAAALHVMRRAAGW